MYRLEREVTGLRSRIEELQLENNKTKEDVDAREAELHKLRQELRASQYAYMK